ncbi:T9SS type A sorting domain-containing protein [Adhaeribacter soli]|uniref:T9SS type A sorting domain-containing protein n=1 Tax=Adhaeribacter soli TaxID=2607655 RepID=A0A5N1J4D9_9BACT|nr:T9SS type A sorting domain-containing protein [Adhaeribacter soli]KAA9340724.1 T9SS type A sorting domain-containing protein [Adhaeribacter soli]
MKKLLFFFAFATLVAFRVNAQFGSLTNLHPINITTDTKDKPQSKVWSHGGSQWTALATDTGAYLWRLDGTTWTNVLKLSSTDYGRADCKVVGNVTHIFLFRGEASHLVSVEYVPATNTYKRWSVRKNKVPVMLDMGAETATIDIDGTGRMWLVSDSPSKIKVRWSDAPYTTWNGPIILASGVNQDDLGAVVAMPATNQIGVFWSDQTTRRFGFKTHNDADPPTVWSADEVPASQSALQIGGGMVDDHLNLTVASDGTIYAAVKTSYNDPLQPQLGLLVRRPSGAWDNLYEVTRMDGTRPIVLLNETAGKIKVVYPAAELGGDILYRESPVNNIAFGPAHTLMAGMYNYASSSKQPYNSEVVIIASGTNQAVSVLANEQGVLGTSTNIPDSGNSTVLQAHPNPFNSQATINFTVPKNEAYTLTLHDLKGSQATVLAQGKALTSEKTEYRINGTGLANGIYLVKLQTGNAVKVLRLILQK